MIGYFLSMILIGTWFGRGQSSTKTFSWDNASLGGLSVFLVATTIGSSSFVKYSKIAYCKDCLFSNLYERLVLGSSVAV